MIATKRAKMASLSSPSPTISARLLAPLERLPDSLQESFTELLQLDPNWIWVVQVDGVVVGYLAACQCHGLALIMRLRLERDLPSAVLVVLFRKFFEDIRERKCRGYMSFFDVTSDVEKRLMLLVHRTGGVIMGRTMVMVCSKLPSEGL